MSASTLLVSLHYCESLPRPRINELSWYHQGLKTVLSPNRCFKKIAEMKEEKTLIKTILSLLALYNTAATSHTWLFKLKLNKI